MGIATRIGLTGQRAGGGFNPAALFGADLVSWYDLSDPATLFQDSAGATPVTASGQSIGRVNDKGSAAQAILQASSGLRPLYNVSSGLHSAAFDGSDDALATAGNINLSGTDKITIFAAVRKNQVATSGIISEFSENYNTNAGSWYLVDGGVTLPGARFSSASRGAAVAAVAQGSETAASYPAGTNAVLIASHDISGDRTTLEANGVAAPNGTGDKGAGNFGNYPLFVGARGGTSGRVNINLYQHLIVRRLCTADEIAAMRTWLASKSGVTL